jgi:formylglycine-generating enzyme required for sulfatase activity
MGITIETVRVRRAGNKPDTTGYGRVDSNYGIGKYEITISQYTAFLNAVAASDPYRLYNPSLMTNPINGGITRSGSDGSYVYTPITGTDQLPITGVSWFDAARFVNWLDNGQPSGASSEQTTEDGTYTLNGAINGLSSSRNSINPNTNTSPQYAIPTENEWYKAAFYNPNRKRGADSYYRYATQSNQAPGNKIGSDSNQVNYILDANGFYSITQQPFVNTTQNYLSPVGSYTGSAGPFGTFDQNGGVWEVLDNGGVNRRDVPLRGGAWTSLASLLQSGYSIAAATESEAVNAGFRIVQLGGKQTPERGQRAGQSSQKFAPASEDTSPSKQPLQTNGIELDLITVGNPNNQADPLTGFGAVSDTFQISSNVITIGQYTTFLNAVAKRDRNNLFNPMMQRDLNVAGIERLGQPGNYKYRTINNDGDSADRPITYVSWLDAARFANWMSNGQPSGPQNNRTTENGAYNLKQNKGQAPERNAINPNTGQAPFFFLPTEDQWYKAAYFSPELNDTGGYYLYATQSNTAPTSTPSTGGSNEANLANNFIFYTTQSKVYDPLTNYLTDVGTFSQSRSFYGTTDQAGLVYEWNDLNATPSPLRGLRGGYWFSAGQSAVSTTYSISTIDRESSDAGFRIAAVDPLSVMPQSSVPMA